METHANVRPLIEYHDPRAAPGLPVEPYELRLEHANPTIGLLANSFPDSIAFLDTVERSLKTALPTATIRRYAKPNASMPATDQLLDGIAAECHAVVTAYGH